VSDKKCLPVYRIHPAIGIARLGDSPDEFCISPETPAALPIACDEKGNPLPPRDGETFATVKTFKDKEGRFKRQAARFHIYVYDDVSPEGRPLELGAPVEGGGNRGTLIDVQWRVYLANKKSAWYQFNQLEGEHGYLPGHPLRNPDITDPDARQCLIIDPGPQVVDKAHPTATFDRGANGLYAATFPPQGLQPRDINTLGKLLRDDNGRLLVLGGHGFSGSMRTGFSQPRIDHYANNDGWFDDTSDGPVMARLIMHSEEVDRTRFIDVEYPAWVVAGYPAYVPEILDMITADDVLYNTSITEFATRTDLYGEAGTFQKPQTIDHNDMGALMHWKASNLMWNPDYKPWFYRDIWPILFRADEYTYLTNVLAQSNYPHNQTSRGNFDPEKLSIPPSVNRLAFDKAQKRCVVENQCGELFLEALEPALALLDEQSLNRRHPVRTNQLAALGGTHDVRKKLSAALQAFAAAVNPDPALDDPDGYVRRWQSTYEGAQNAKADQGASYRTKSNVLHGVIRDVLKQLQAQVTLEKETPPTPRRGLMGPKRIGRDDGSPPQIAVDPNEPVEAAFERLYTAYRSGKLLTDRLAKVRAENTFDPFLTYRTYLYDLLRKDGEENVFRLEGKPTSRVHHLPLMPLLAGDNPISNMLPSKFLRLTEYQLYLLRQWQRGEFYNEISNKWVPEGSIDPWQPYKGIVNKTARQLDQNVLSNLAGGAFCPGAELGWLIRNPAIYREPYRIKADPNFYSFRQTAANQNQSAAPLSVPEEDYVAATGATLSQDSNYKTGLQPGDLTKMMALPWQADFNECSTQDVDVTYEEWNVIDAKNPKDPWMKVEQMVWETLWWPAHRPMQTWELVPGTESDPAFQYLTWARGVPQTNAGDLKMTTEWSHLGIVIRNPFSKPSDLDQASPPGPKYIAVERSQDKEPAAP
jgi:hypothetical protein